MTSRQIKSRDLAIKQGREWVRIDTMLSVEDSIAWRNLRGDRTNSAALKECIQIIGRSRAIVSAVERASKS